MLILLPQYKSLRELLMDQKLAALGDAYINFVYSIALSKRIGEPTGAKVDNRLLAQALRKAGLRDLLPSRIDRHKQANAAEALFVYAWLRGVMRIEEGVKILDQHKDMVEAFCNFLLFAKEKINQFGLT